jgi:prevent-host-death family protein
MEITTKQLRIQPGRIISQVNNGQEIIVTYRGKACAKIVPVAARNNVHSEDDGDEIFGMWKARKEMEDVEKYVRNIRKGRKLC